MSSAANPNNSHSRPRASLIIWRVTLAVLGLGGIAGAIAIGVTINELPNTDAAGAETFALIPFALLLVVLGIWLLIASLPSAGRRPTGESRFAAGSSVPPTLPVRPMRFNKWAAGMIVGLLVLAVIAIMLG